ncbi:condensation domain-containing protein [Vibrio sp. PP-XX7]
MSASLLQQDFGRCVDSEIAMATVFAYLHLMTGKSSITVGFPFMRRMGYKALQATGPVVNVLPLTLSVTPSMTLAEIAHQLTQALRTVRRHQQYDAEQLKRDLGRLNEPLYGPLLNFKRFDDALEFEGIAAQTHVLAAGPIDDIEFSPTLRGSGFSLALSANAQRYSPAQLTRHGDRFARLVEQLAVHPNCPLAVVDWILLRSGSRLNPGLLDQRFLLLHTIRRSLICWQSK